MADSRGAPPSSGCDPYLTAHLRMNTRRPHIVHLITSLNIGGTEKNMLEIIRRLPETFRFTVCYLKQRGPVADELKSLGVPVRKLSVLGAVPALASMDCSILHTHLFRANVLGRVWGRLAGIPVVISSQQGIDAWKTGWTIAAERISARFADRIIANSRAARNVLIERERIPAEKIGVIYNGIRFDGTSVPRERVPGPFRISCIMRLHREKGVNLVPDIALAARRRTAVRFSVIGDGPLRRELSGRISEGDLRDEVILEGWRDDLDQVYRRTDVLLLPSEEESFPQVALDALSYGIPVVATRVGGVPELVEHGSEGLLIETRTPSAYADAIVKLAEDRDLYTTISAKARKKAALFTMERMIAEYETLYRTLLSAPRAPA